MHIEILNRWTNAVIFSGEYASKKEALEAAVKSDSDLSDSNLRGSNLRGSNLRGSNLRDSDLRGSNLRDSDLSDSDLSGSDLRDSDLSGSDLRGSDLRGSNLRDSDLSDSDLSGSNLSGSDLSGSDLSGSDLRDSDLSGSDLRDSDLRDSDLRGSDLRYATANTFRPENLGLTSDPELMRRVAEVIVGDESALRMSEWHTCDTQHCLAGWSIHLSGPAGYALEKATSSSVAGCILVPDMAHLFFETSDPGKVREFCRGVLEPKKEEPAAT